MRPKQGLGEDSTLNAAASPSPRAAGFRASAVRGVIYGDYYLLGRLANGGMAEVFLAKHRDRERSQHLLALKRLLLQFIDLDEFSSMFADEADIAARLNHPHICKTVDSGMHGQQRYLVMEFIHGKNLELLAERALKIGEPMPFTIMAYVLARVAEALDHAHQLRGSKGEALGLVHRDVSPQNILIDYTGVPKLIDFGIAKARGRLAKTEAGVVKGKFAYMAPEQASGKEIDHRTDIFALGIVLYELLTGELPFQGANDLSLLNKIVAGKFKSPFELKGATLPQPLVDITLQCLRVKKKDRFQSALEVARALDDYVGNRVNQSRLSTYVQSLFSQEFIRESERISVYQQVQAPQIGSSDEYNTPSVSGTEPPQQAANIDRAPTPTPRRVRRYQPRFQDPTQTLALTPDLAAGYTKANTPDDASSEPSSKGISRKHPGRGRTSQIRRDISGEIAIPATESKQISEHLSEPHNQSDPHHAISHAGDAKGLLPTKAKSPMLRSDPQQSTRLRPPDRFHNPQVTHERPPSSNPGQQSPIASTPSPSSAPQPQTLLLDEPAFSDPKAVISPAGLAPHPHSFPKPIAQYGSRQELQRPRIKQRLLTRQEHHILWLVGMISLGVLGYTFAATRYGWYIPDLDSATLVQWVLEQWPL